MVMFVGWTARVQAGATQPGNPLLSVTSVDALESGETF